MKAFVTANDVPEISAEDIAKALPMIEAVELVGRTAILAWPRRRSGNLWVTVEITGLARAFARRWDAKVRLVSGEVGGGGARVWLAKLTAADDGPPFPWE